MREHVGTRSESGEGLNMCSLNTWVQDTGTIESVPS